MPETEETDLFKASVPHVFSVTDLTRRVRDVLESALGAVWIEGEVCNYRRQSSGHQYFTLKDDKCQISCVLFYRPAMRLRQVALTDGMLVQVRGNVTVYEARGQYQINVQIVQPAGAGLLQAKFEALKKKLAAEGLFDPENKKPLPEFPSTVGIVTSPTGAAIRDMLNILQRRAPWLHVIINPVRVQGEGAAQEIARAIGEFNSGALPAVDVVVVARGGGSAEDLSQFNEEVLARAIFASVIPVVSAVGHEIDFSIADFVADLRAPTPSAAAELIVPDSVTLLRHLKQLQARASQAMASELARCRESIASLARSALFRLPAARIWESQQRLDYLEEIFDRVMQQRLSMLVHQLASLSSMLRQHRPDQIAQLKRQQLAALRQSLHERAGAALKFQERRLSSVEALLKVLAPEATLQRGYSITTNARDGKLIRSASDAAPGAEISTLLSGGQKIESRVTSQSDHTSR